MNIYFSFLFSSPSIHLLARTTCTSSNQSLNTNHPSVSPPTTHTIERLFEKCPSSHGTRILKDCVLNINLLTDSSVARWCLILKRLIETWITRRVGGLRTSGRLRGSCEVQAVFGASEVQRRNLLTYKEWIPLSPELFTLSSAAKFTRGLGN